MQKVTAFLFSESARIIYWGGYMVLSEASDDAISVIFGLFGCGLFGCELVGLFWSPLEFFESNILSLMIHAEFVL
jgi:hypothetical protein